MGDVLDKWLLTVLLAFCILISLYADVTGIKLSLDLSSIVAILLGALINEVKNVVTKSNGTTPKA